MNGNRYTGYLASYIPEIAECYQRGEPLIRIAERIAERCGVARRDGPHEQNIRYALQRIGIYHSPVKKVERPTERRQRLIDEKDIYVTLPSGKPTRGRPIDMGGPRNVWIEHDPWGGP